MKVGRQLMIVVVLLDIIGIFLIGPAQVNLPSQTLQRFQVVKCLTQAVFTVMKVMRVDQQPALYYLLVSWKS